MNRFVPLALTLVLLAAACSTVRAAEPLGEQVEQLLATNAVSGGLIVHAGCDGGLLPASLAEHDSFLIHGLVRDANRLDAVRATIRQRGLYGRATAVLWDGRRLPYADHSVNLLLVSEEAVEVAPEEIDRVLAPGGTAMVVRNGETKTHRSPWPDDIDQWTHARYDATGNPTSRDEQVGPPRYVQWYAGPRWNHSVKTSALVSTGGRIFYILDDSHFAARQRSWAVIARDAFNGVRLWRHELPTWGGAFGGKKVGPVQMHRKLIAQDDRVYATLEQFAPVSVLDAGSGEVLRALPETDYAEEMILSDGVLVVLVNPNTPTDVRRGMRQAKSLVALRAENGEVLWRRPLETILPLCLAADGEQVVYHDGERLESLSLTTGQPRWTSAPTGQKVIYPDAANPDRPGAEPSTIWIAPQFAPTLMIYGDVVAFAGGKQLNVVTAVDGKELWRADFAASNYSVPVDLFGFGGLLWGPDAGMNVWSPGRPRTDSLYFNSYDPQTGEVQDAIRRRYGFIFQHHRCHQMKAVGRTILAARAGIEFLDTETEQVLGHHWIRGSCHYGVMPANGMLYVPPHDCACFVRAKLPGFFALRSNRAATPPEVPASDRLEHGPAFGQASADAVAVQPADWPTYRCDTARSGRAGTTLAPKLEPSWETHLEGKLSSPVIAGGRVFLAQTDAHRVVALDAADGRLLWERTVGGRVDSPPTIHEGLALFGCRDGWIYALRAADGALAWRFRAAPHARWIVSQGQLESAWPVHGSVLVVNGTLYAAAGRSSYLDGGVHLVGLDPHTGEVRFQKVLDSRDADGRQVFDEEGVDGYLNDVLSSDGRRLFLRHQVFDLEGNPVDEAIAHLHGADGFLSDTTTHRLQWSYAPRYTSLHQGAFYDMRLSRTLYPSGRILVEDEQAVYGFGQNHYEQPQPEPGGQFALFAAPKGSDVPDERTMIEYRRLALRGEVSVGFHWWRPIPTHAWAMLQAGDVLFVAGPGREALGSQAALDGEAEGLLLTHSTTDGAPLARMPLPSTPVWDGMAAAAGRLYVCTRDGRVVCLAPVAAP